MKGKALLLNPPGSALFLREYYCSKTPKSHFTYYPIDLYYISGRLSEEYDTRVLDCMAEGVGRTECMRRIEKMDPDAIISLTGHISWAEDVEFFRILAKNKKRKIIASGDILLSSTGRYIGADMPLDAILLDFTSEDILFYLRGDYARIKYMNYRVDGSQFICDAERESGGEFNVPPPRLDLFPYHKYHFPVVRRHPFGVVLTDYGCPYKCNFCVMNTLGHKQRSIENVLEEMDMLKSYNIRELLFMDQTFGAAPGRSKTLLREMLDRNYGFEFACWTRADLATGEWAGLLRKAGCHTVMMGAETHDDKTLALLQKGEAVEAITRGFRIFKKAGIRTLGTFIIGLRGQAAKDCMKTINYAIALDPDYASFNVAIPRAGTKLREEFIRDKLVEDGSDVVDQSGIALTYIGYLDMREVSALLKTAELKFYMRFSYIVKRLFSARTAYEMRNMLTAGCSILARGFGKRIKG